MKKFLIIVLPLFLILGFALGRYFAQPKDHRGHEMAVEPEIPKTKALEAVAPVLVEKFSKAGEPIDEKTVQENKEKVIAHFKNAGLSESKIEAMLSLDDFYRKMPEFNEENIAKRDAFLQKLNEDSAQTLESFKTLISTTSPKDDDIRSFLMNTTMALDASDYKKAEVYVARVNQGASFREDGAVEDNELSLVIGLSQLSRLEDNEAKLKALEEILSNEQIQKNPAYKQLLKDYFPSASF